MEHITKLTLSGITCSSCQFVIEKRLKTINGIQGVGVNIQTGKITISANRKIELSEITLALSDTHYKIVSSS